jgi:hypothetical protein
MGGRSFGLNLAEISLPYFAPLSTSILKVGSVMKMMSLPLNFVGLLENHLGHIVRVAPNLELAHLGTVNPLGNALCLPLILTAYGLKDT